jgi:hypothetical protein
MSQDMLTKSLNIIAIIDSMDERDRVTTLAMISARYQKVTGKDQKVSIGKLSVKGGGEPTPSSKKKEAESNAGNFLGEVSRTLDPLLKVLPKVSRQQGSVSPHMDLKSVQRRLNKKRSELQKELDLLLVEPGEAMYAYRSLNAIQSFRIAAKDATVTKGCRLPTNPIPEGFGGVLGILNDLALSLKREGKVASNGFFTDEDHQFQTSGFENNEHSNPDFGNGDTSQQEPPSNGDSW